jgi:uncharacterized protein (TIGR02646 family)
MPGIRRSIPARTCTATKTNYRSYKRDLVVDFQHRCGYCDGHDSYSGGYKNFHIDHFAPKKKFPHLEHSYSNLVYACFYCNNAKSDHWPSNSHDVSVVGNSGFVDPCSDDYDTHLLRAENGEIVPLTPLGNYMFDTLHLGLKRHSIIWATEELFRLIDEIEEILQKAGPFSKEAKVLESAYNCLLREYRTSMKHFREGIE